MLLFLWLILQDWNQHGLSFCDTAQIGHISGFEEKQIDGSEDNSYIAEYKFSKYLLAFPFQHILILSQVRHDKFWKSSKEEDLWSDSLCSEERIASVKLTTAVDSQIWLFKHSYLYRHISAVAICVLFALNSIFSLERERPITKKVEKSAQMKFQKIAGSEADQGFELSLKLQIARSVLSRIFS